LKYPQSRLCKTDKGVSMNESVRTMVTIGGIEVMVEISNDGINFIDEDGKIEKQRWDIIQALVDAKD